MLSDYGSISMVDQDKSQKVYERLFGGWSGGLSKKDTEEFVSGLLFSEIAVHNFRQNNLKRVRTIVNAVFALADSSVK